MTLMLMTLPFLSPSFNAFIGLHPRVRKEEKRSRPIQPRARRTNAQGDGSYCRDSIAQRGSLLQGENGKGQGWKQRSSTAQERPSRSGQSYASRTRHSCRERSKRDGIGSKRKDPGQSTGKETTKQEERKQRSRSQRSRHKHVDGHECLIGIGSGFTFSLNWLYILYYDDDDKRRR